MAAPVGAVAAAAAAAVAAAGCRQSGLRPFFMHLSAAFTCERSPKALHKVQDTPERHSAGRWPMHECWLGQCVVLSNFTGAPAIACMHAAAARASLRLLTPRACSARLWGARQLRSGIMTRTRAQGRGQEDGDAGGKPAAAAAAATSDAPAAAPAAPKFSPALTQIDPSQYEAQLEAKVARVTAQFAEFNPPPLQAFRSQPQHYRMR